MTIFRLLACSLLLTLSSICSLAADSYREVWQLISTPEQLLELASDTCDVAIVATAKNDNLTFSLTTTPYYDGIYSGLVSTPVTLSDDKIECTDINDALILSLSKDDYNHLYFRGHGEQSDYKLGISTDANHLIFTNGVDHFFWWYHTYAGDGTFSLDIYREEEPKTKVAPYLSLAGTNTWFNNNTSSAGNTNMRLYARIQVPIEEPVKPQTPKASFSADGIDISENDAVSLTGLGELTVTLTAGDGEDIYFRWDSDYNLARSHTPAEGFEPYTDAIAIRSAGTLSFYSVNKATETQSETRTITFTGRYGTVSLTEIHSNHNAVKAYNLIGRQKAPDAKGLTLYSNGAKTLR